MMNFATLCSGIGAPEVAAHALGMTPVFCSEIEPFPCAVLAHHWPDVPNYGDMTDWREWPHHDLDLLIAGTPCQAFSVAGLRQGLDDARGNLTLEFARYADHVRPRFVLWENVPGVLSDKSNAFGCLLGGLAGCDAPLLPRGGRWTNAGFVSGPRRQIAWRILDAQHFGVAQRRRRVWLCAGDVERGAGGWACARALFPERGGVRGDSPQGGAAGEEVAGASGGGSHWDGVPNPTLSLSSNSLSNQELFGQRGAGLVDGATYFEPRFTLQAGHHHAVAVYESHGQDSRVTDLGDTCSTVSAKYGTGGGNVPLVSVGFNGDQSEKTHSMGEHTEQSPTLRADGPAHAAMVHWQQGGGEVEDEVSGALRANAEHSYQFARIRSTVRRLTPRECERLQGFPDDHTAVQHRNKPACDGPRYKALGNSMAVPCIQFILGNLMEVDR